MSIQGPALSKVSARREPAPLRAAAMTSSVPASVTASPELPVFKRTSDPQVLPAELLRTSNVKDVRQKATALQMQSLERAGRCQVPSTSSGYGSSSCSAGAHSNGGHGASATICVQGPAADTEDDPDFLLALRLSHEEHEQAARRERRLQRNSGRITEQELLLMEAIACSMEEDAREERLARELLGMDMDYDFNELGTLSAEAPPRKEGVGELLLSTLPVDTWPRGSEAQECPLCLSDYEAGERVMRLPCLHQAHEECMVKWLQRSIKCPNCKTDVQESMDNPYSSAS